MGFKECERKWLDKLAGALGVPADNLRCITVRAASDDVITVTVERCATTGQVEAVADLLSNSGGQVVVNEVTVPQPAPPASYRVVAMYPGSLAPIWEGESLTLALAQGQHAIAKGGPHRVELRRGGELMASWWPDGRELVKRADNSWSHGSWEE